MARQLVRKQPAMLSTDTAGAVGAGGLLVLAPAPNTTVVTVTDAMPRRPVRRYGRLADHLTGLSTVTCASSAMAV